MISVQQGLWRRIAPTGIVLGAVLVMAAAGCGSGSSSGGGTGRVEVSMTDAPFPVTTGCLVAADLVVDEVSIKGSNDSFIFLPMTVTPPATINVFELRSGLALDLAAGDLPTGTYTEIRL